MKYLITGATGFIGTQLAKRLANEGHTVHALYRSESKTTELKSVDGVRLFKGDIMEPDSLRRATLGCDGVFHVAAFAKPWAQDKQTFHRLNVQGALNVFVAARHAGANRIVFTSTAGVISPSNGKPSDEDTPRKQGYFTEYERSKAIAEEKAREFSAEGMEIVTVNPTRVFGPGLMSESNGVTKMVKLFLKGKFRTLPGDGNSIGNYVYIDDVVDGHVKAMNHGKAGERYILGGDNVSFNEFFDIVSDLSGKTAKLYKIPIPLIHLAAKVMETRANLTGVPPLITPPWVRKYLFDWELSSEKAKRELGYNFTPIQEGLEMTVDWILHTRGRKATAV